MSNLGSVAGISRRACYCSQFQTLTSRLRNAIRAQKNQRDRVLNSLTPEKAHKIFPFPGFIGPTSTSGASCVNKNAFIQVINLDLEDQRVSDVFGSLNLQDSRLSSLQRQLTSENPMESRARKERPTGVRYESDQVECVVQDCTGKMRKSFADLFPSGMPDGTAENLSAVIVSHRTTNDMSVWSSEMELERDELTGQFVELAIEIVQALRDNDVWADFIDPQSGRPFFSPYTNATLFETDDRYKQFGFCIQDLGCCKCLEHPLWGAKAFVGCILTTASSSHPVLKEIIQSKIE